jgi:hypothetical protein
MLISRTISNGKGEDLMTFLFVETGPFNKNYLFDIIVADVTMKISLFDQLVR